MLFPELMVTCMVSPVHANDFLHFNPPSPNSAKRPGLERVSAERRAWLNPDGASISTATAFGLTRGCVLFRDTNLGDGVGNQGFFGLLLEAFRESYFPLIPLCSAVHDEACESPVMKVPTSILQVRILSRCLVLWVESER